MIKYCPNCKKMVTVVKGGKPYKQRYKCCECYKRFVDRSYGIEIRSLAVKACEYGCSLRAVARVLGVSPNSVRNWCKENIIHPIFDKELIEIVKKYKWLCESISTLKAKINELKIEQENAAIYWELHRKRRKVGEQLDKLQVGNYYEAKKFSEIMNLDSEYKKLSEKIKKLKIPKDNLSVEEIEAELSSVECEYRKQKKLKVKLETQTVFAREQYDMDEIVNILVKITQT